MKSVNVSFKFLAEQNSDGDYFDSSSPTSSRNNYHTAAMTTSTPFPTTPSARGRPKGSTNAKSSKNKPSKAHVSFSEPIPIENQTTKLDSQTNVLHTVDEEVPNFLHKISLISNIYETRSILFDINFFSKQLKKTGNDLKIRKIVFKLF